MSNKRQRVEETKTKSVEDEFAAEFLKYIDATPTPFHLCAETGSRLKDAGFKQLDEGQPWNLSAGDKCFYTRNRSTLVAFVVGGKYGASFKTDGVLGGFKIVGAHTDSPVLKLKPVSKKSAFGYMQIGVECYGGGLWHTWFDRDLSVAGSVVVAGDDGTFSRRLVHITRPLFRVPNLCIHLQSADERKAFAPNKENHLQPIISTIEQELNKKQDEAGDKEDDGGKLDERHAPELLRILGEELGCHPSAIKELELSLCDTQGGSTWGSRNEFLSSPRLDNQCHCFTSMKGLIDFANDDAAVAKDEGVSLIALFDHEEVGSQSACGAGSPVMADAISRISGCFVKQLKADQNEMHRIVVQRSFQLSADVAHAIHPNYASKHEAKHQPVLNKGTVIKTNDNQRYATNSVTGFVVRELGRMASVPVQEFVVRNDCPCGTTIGPIVAAKTGVRTVDIGIPSLSMHSIRETIGVADLYSNANLFKTFYRHFHELDKKCKF